MPAINYKAKSSIRIMNSDYTIVFYFKIRIFEKYFSFPLQKESLKEGRILKINPLN